MEQVVMDTEEFRRRLKATRRRTPGQRIGDTIRASRSLRKWHIASDAAERGLSFEKAALLAGLKPRGLRGLLYKHTGSTCWPPKEDS